MQAGSAGGEVDGPQTPMDRLPATSADTGCRPSTSKLMEERMMRVVRLLVHLTVTVTVTVALGAPAGEQVYSPESPSSSLARCGRSGKSWRGEVWEVGGVEGGRWEV